MNEKEINVIQDIITDIEARKTSQYFCEACEEYVQYPAVHKNDCLKLLLSIDKKIIKK